MVIEEHTHLQQQQKQLHVSEEEWRTAYTLNASLPIQCIPKFDENSPELGTASKAWKCTLTEWRDSEKYTKKSAHSVSSIQKTTDVGASGLQ